MLEHPDEIISVGDVARHYHTHRSFGTKKPSIKAVDGVSFSLRKGEILGIIGESGCGKSTLGRLLVMMDDATSGSIDFYGRSIKTLYKQNRLSFHRMAQMIFQNPFDTFDPRYRIGKVLLDAMKLHHIGAHDHEREAICIGLMERYNLTPARDFLDRFPHELSGGQLQRISILRSMLLQPQFVVADEPTSMLDVSVRADILTMLLELCKEQNAAMVFISHDIVSTRYIADKVAVMYLGRFVEVGETDKVLHNPQHPYTRALISNSISHASNAQEVIRLKGEPPSPGNTPGGCYFYSRCFKAQPTCQSSYPALQEIGGGHQVSCFHPG